MEKKIWLKNVFCFNVYFRRFIDKIVYISTLPDCLNSYV